MDKIVFIFLISIFFMRTYAQSLADANLCVPVEKIDLNPFREIKDGKDLAYLVLLRSYISANSSEPGILSKYEFSPDGKEFRGQINKNLKWSDGSDLTVHEAAFGIARGIKFRPIGKRVWVLGTESIKENDWENRNYSGIKIIDKFNFRLLFKSEIANLTGVVREALSTNSRHNRLWPIQQRKKITDAYRVLAKFPQIDDPKSFLILFNKKKILITNRENCKDVDFTIFAEVLGKNIPEYKFKKSTNASAITAQLNTSKLTREERKQLAGFLRLAFSNKDFANTMGIQAVDNFFIPGENGHNPKLGWPNDFDIKKIKKKEIKIAYEIPLFKIILDKFIHNNGLRNIRLIPLPTKKDSFDIQILASGIQQGRHVILQDVLQWPHVRKLLSKSPLNEIILKKIAEKSASTLPPDNETLMEFESQSLSDFSFVPLARRYPIAYSKKGSSFCLDWTSQGELTFSAKEKCEQ